MHRAPLELPFHTTYDARGNLLSVMQGSQTRTFAYDEQSRLKRATMPECQTITVNGVAASTHYTYDRDGNVKTSTDGRNIVATNGYDEMDRILTVTYTGATTSTPTPNVSYYYDSATIPGLAWSSAQRGSSLGRLVGIVTSPITLGSISQGETAVLMGYDNAGRQTRTRQVLDGVSYDSSATLNEGGAPTQETYPAGTSYTYGYNSSGQLNTISRGATQMLKSAAYTPSGSLLKQQYGNNLWHTISYNSRLQPATIALGTTTPTTTTPNPAERLKLEYSYGVLSSANSAGQSINAGQNNGNVARIGITPGQNQNLVEQDFLYDPLNRLQTAAEYYTPVTAPALSGITPSQGVPGTSITVTLTGQNLSNAILTVNATDVLASIITNTATQITAQFTIAANANPALGPRKVKVATAGGESNELGFLVTSATVAAKDTPCLYDTSVGSWQQRYSNSAGNADNTFFFGPGGTNPPWIPIKGDWDTDGEDSPGLYSPDSAVFQTNDNATGNADNTFFFGPANAGWKPVAGDWNGDGTDSVGLFEPTNRFFYLKNLNQNGNADYAFSFGPASSTLVPLAGDWNGDGVDTVGVFDTTTRTFFLRNTNSSGAADVQITFGGAGDLPVVGDWNNDGVDTIGVYRPTTGEWFLKNANSNPAQVDLAFVYGPSGLSLAPLAGDWNGAAARPAAYRGDGGEGSSRAGEIQSWREDYQYDRYGNRTDSLVPAPDGATNRLASGSGFVYDAPGNLIQESAGQSTRTYKYNANNKMWQAALGSRVTTYVYDGAGRRVKKIDDNGTTTTTKFIYGMDDKLVAEITGSVTKEYVYGTIDLLATVEGAVTQYLTADHLGSPRVITNAGTGGVLSRHDYMPFGEELGVGVGGRSGTGLQGYGVTDGVRQQFTSKERDAETGLDYFGARYYGSGQGRFTSVDPLMMTPVRKFDPQRLNLYAFVRNNPMKYRDPDGRDLQLATGQKRADVDRIISIYARLFQKASTRSVLNSAEASAKLVLVEKGKLPSTEFGLTEPKGRITTDPKTGKATSVDVAGVIVTYDFDKLDRHQAASKNGKQPAVSDQKVGFHETGHLEQILRDPVENFNQTPGEREDHAEKFAVGAEGEPDSLSPEEAEKLAKMAFGYESYQFADEPKPQPKGE